jgi:hypothetical protein
MGPAGQVRDDDLPLMSAQADGSFFSGAYVCHGDRRGGLTRTRIHHAGTIGLQRVRTGAGTISAQPLDCLGPGLTVCLSAEGCTVVPGRPRRLLKRSGCQGSQEVGDVPFSLRRRPRFLPDRVGARWKCGDCRHHRCRRRGDNRADGRRGWLIHDLGSLGTSDQQPKENRE